MHEKLDALTRALREEEPDVISRVEAKTGMKFNVSAYLTEATQTPLALRDQNWRP